MDSLTTTEDLVRRDRFIVTGGLVMICALSWLFLWTGAGTGMNAPAMSTWQFPPPVDDPGMAMQWSAGYWLIMIVMWWVMMIAMMVPSAAPMILLYGRVSRHAQTNGRMEAAGIPTAAFAGGYLLGWLAFSVVAVCLQSGLEWAGLLHSMMMWSTSTVLSGSFLIAAGLYQLSPLKAVCLQHCRSPVDYLSRHWRKGRFGALRMGLEHGLYCVGCCWVLMVLLFAGGIMNIVWIAGLAIFVLIEKLARFGPTLGRCAGLFLIAAGAYLLI